MEESKQPNVIDLVEITKKIWTERKLFAKTLPLSFIVGCIYILGFPRYYTASVKLAPEVGGVSVSSTIGSIASSFGFDLDEMQSNDAITPLLYPDLMEDNGFVAELLKVQIVTKDGSIKTSYHDYLQKHQKPSWWILPVIWIKKLFAKPPIAGWAEMDPYNIPKSEYELAESVRGNIKIEFNKKTALITINVEAQDPLVCRTMADSTMERLQQFIINYRTSKARNDYEYYQKLANDAKHEYEKTRQIYANMADANTKIALKSVEMKLEDLENDLQLKFNTYTTVSTQMQAAKAKVQERTPAFTTIKGASVPVKPAGPKRMIFILVVLVLTAVGTSAYILMKKKNIQ